MTVRIRSELIRGHDPAWETWLQGVPRDVFHTAGYHAYAQGSGEGEPYLAIVGDRRRGVAWPYLLRRVAEIPELKWSDSTDVTSVYGYPGPIAWGCRPGDEFLTAAWSAIMAIWREQGAVSAFTRFHPLLGNAALVSDMPGTDAFAHRPGHVVVGGTTVSVDLTLGDDATRRAYSRGLRREIEASRRQGLATVQDEAWEELPTFARLYRETMIRNRAAAYYFFGEADFRRLRDCVPGHLHLLVTRLGGTVAAASLFTEFDGIVEWYLAASGDEFRALAPTKVLVDDAIRWARERGWRVLHLGGGRGGRDDSLLWFKGRFSPRRHPFHTGRWVLDRDAYEALVAARRTREAGDAGADGGFFPAYRASPRGTSSPGRPTADPPEGQPGRTR